MDAHRLQAPNALHYFWLANGLFLFTVYGSLIPLQFQPLPLDQAQEQFRALQVIEVTLTEARADWVVNMVQFAAVSFCYLAALCLDRRRVFGLLGAAVVVPAAWAAAVGIEFLQVYFPPRTVGINDILVECLGAVLGAVGWLLVGQRLADWLRRFWGSKGMAGLASQALPAYLGLLLVVQLMPFDVVLGRQEIAQKFQEGRVQLVPFGALLAGRPGVVPHLLANLLAFLTLGALLALVPRWSGRSLRTILLFALGVTVPIELLQLVIYTRHCDVTDVLTGTAAVLLGWMLVRGLRDAWVAEQLGFGGFHAAWGALLRGAAPWGPGPWVAMVLGWAAVLVAVNWQPFHFSTDPADFLQSDPTLSDENTPVYGLRRMSWAPFVDYYWGSRYQALDQFVRRSLSFAPLGILLALAFGRQERRGVVTTVLAALLLGLLIELGQYFIPERHPGVTDLLIQVAGAWLGYKLTRHVVHALGPIPEVGVETRYRSATGKARPVPGFAATLKDWLSRWPGGLASRRGRGGKTGPSLGSRLNDLLYWLHAQPHWLRMLLICLAASLLSLGFVYLLNMLGFI